MAISIVIWTGDQFELVSFSVPPTNSRAELLAEEAKVVNQVAKIFDAGRPTMFSWNGMRFDQLLLQLRMIAHSVISPSYWNGPRYNDYRSRYDNAHIDLMDELMNKTGERINLNTAAGLFGFPLKSGIGGAEVPTAYHDGKSSEISIYCDVDTLLLIGLVIKFKFVRDQVNETLLNAFIDLIDRLVQNGHSLLVEDDYHVKLKQPLYDMLKILKQ